MLSRAPLYPLVVHDAGRASNLEWIARSGACEAGRVMALDFAAVRTAGAAHWDAQSAEAHTRIEQGIQRLAPRGTTVLRITDFEYLVSFADMQWAEAQTTAFDIVETLLREFSGEFSRENVVVRCVSSITSEGLTMHTLSLAKLERIQLNRNSASAPSGQPASSLIESPAERLSLGLEPQDIIHLQSGLKIGTRLSISLYRVGSSKVLSSRDEYRLSTNALLQATLQAANALLDLMDKSRAPSIFVLPLFVQAMTNSRGRGVILNEFRRLRSFDRRRLIIEITGIEPGTHSSRLLETHDQLKPFCRAVTGRVQLERSALNTLSAARLSGVHFSARDLGSSPAQRAAGLLAAGQSARNLAPIVMAVDLPDPEALNVCKVAGFSHATVPASRG